MIKPKVAISLPDNTVIIREMTDEEYQSHLAAEKLFLFHQLERENESVIRTSALAKLEALGLTAEEAQAIAGI